MLTLDGRPLTDFGLVLLRGHEHPVLPRTDDRIIPVPGGHGEWDQGATMRGRTFQLPLQFVGRANSRELQAAVRQFAAFLIGRDGRPRTIRLVFDTEPHLFYNVRYSGRLEIRRLMETGEFTLPLIAVDPWAYAVAETVVAATITASPQTVTLNVGGTVETPAVIVVRNTGAAAITSITITLAQEV